MTFNPDIERLKENLDSVYPQVEGVVIVDNASANIEEVADLLKAYDNVDLVRGEINRGIACALNCAMEWGFGAGSDAVLLLDQDSVCSSGMVAGLRNSLGGGVAIAAPSIIDRNLNPARDDDAQQPLANGDEHRVVFVDYCITSGSLCRTAAWKAIGGYDEGMFIDFVDFDFCLRLRMDNFGIVRVSSVNLLHEIGKSRRIWKFTSYGHSAFRTYHMAIDMIYYARKHRSSPVQLKVQGRGVFATYLVLLKKAILVGLFETDRRGKLSAIIRGTVRGSVRRVKTENPVSVDRTFAP